MARAARRIASRAEIALRRVNPALGIMCARAISTAASRFDDTIPVFQEVKVLGEDEDDYSQALDLLAKLEGKDGSILRLGDPDPLQVAIEDIDNNRFGEVVVVSKKGLRLSYGERGVSASDRRTPRDLLTYEMELPERSIGTLLLPEHVPFSIDGEEGLAFAACALERVLPHRDNISRYSLHQIIEMPADTAKVVSIKLQERIFTSKDSEEFFEETTLPVKTPDVESTSSLTLMNFEKQEPGFDSTTDMHFHPGKRVLIVYTTGRSAGVTLNFCGVDENPDERKDSEVKLKFKPNSASVLTFPAFCHHKFEGAFDCASIHPRDGIGIIEALKEGRLTGGFLEGATTFSKTTTKIEEKWKMGFEIPGPISEEKEKEHDLERGRQ